MRLTTCVAGSPIWRSKGNTVIKHSPKLSKLRQPTFNEEGFSLIEIIIVVVIIGVLAAIAIPAFMNQQKAAVHASMKSDIKNTNLNIATYLTKNPTAPASALANHKRGANVPDWNYTQVLQGNYDIVLSDPHTTISVWGNGYQRYCIRAWNITLSPEASLTVMGDTDLYYASITGKYSVASSEC